MACICEDGRWAFGGQGRHQTQPLIVRKGTEALVLVVPEDSGKALKSPLVVEVHAVTPHSGRRFIPGLAQLVRRDLAVQVVDVVEPVGDITL
jgi:hypothetical protein